MPVGYRAHGKTVRRKGKVEGMLRAPTYREIGVKIRVPVFWILLKKIREGKTSLFVFCGSIFI